MSGIQHVPCMLDVHCCMLPAGGPLLGDMIDYMDAAVLAASSNTGVSALL
jgi:hypothetical protein